MLGSNRGTAARSTPTSTTSAAAPLAAYRARADRRLQDLTRDRKLALLNRLVDRGDNNLYLVELATGKETLLTPHRARAASRASSPGTAAASTSRPTPAATSPRSRALCSTRRAGPGKIEILAARADAELGLAIDDAGTTAAILWNVAGRSELGLWT